MKKRDKLIHLIVCIWLLSLYFSIGKTSYLLSSVKTLEDALNLISLKQNFLAAFVRVIMDNRSHVFMIVIKIIQLIPVSSYLMLVIVYLYQKELKHHYFSLLFLGPLLIFVLDLLILAFALNMMDVSSAISFATSATRICFILSILGCLASIIYWYMVESALIE